MKKIGILPNRLVHPHRVPDNRGIRMLLVIIVVFISVVVVKSASPTEIVMRFIDGNSGKPLTGVGLQVLAWRVDESNPKSEKLLMIWNTKTDKNGRVLVRLQEPFPEHLSYRSPNELRECSYERFSVQDAIRSGIVGNYKEKCGKLKAIATATPGEIVVFDRKYKFLD